MMTTSKCPLLCYIPLGGQLIEINYTCVCVYMHQSLSLRKPLLLICKNLGITFFNRQCRAEDDVNTFNNLYCNLSESTSTRCSTMSQSSFGYPATRGGRVWRGQGRGWWGGRARGGNYRGWRGGGFKNYHNNRGGSGNNYCSEYTILRFCQWGSYY